MSPEGRDMEQDRGGPGLQLWSCHGAREAPGVKTIENR